MTPHIKAGIILQFWRPEMTGMRNMSLTLGAEAPFTTIRDARTSERQAIYLQQ